MGQLTSPLFSQEREVSAIVFSVSGSRTHSSVLIPKRDTVLFSNIGRPVRDVDSCSSLEEPLSKGKRSRELESVQLSQIESGRILSARKKAFINSLTRELIEVLQENLQLRHDYLRYRMNWTEEIGKDEMLILLFMKLVDSSNPIGWSSTRQISCLIRLKRKRAGYVKKWA